LASFSIGGGAEFDPEKEKENFRNVGLLVQRFEELLDQEFVQASGSGQDKIDHYKRHLDEVRDDLRKGIESIDMLSQPFPRRRL
jgi:hypothetical protein